MFPQTNPLTAAEADRPRDDHRCASPGWPDCSEGRLQPATKNDLDNLRHMYLNHVRSSGDGCEFKIINDTSYLCRYIYMCVLILLYTWLCTYIYTHIHSQALFVTIPSGFHLDGFGWKGGIGWTTCLGPFCGVFYIRGGIAFEKVWFSLAIWGLSQTCSIPSHDLSMFIIVFPWELL